jgi:hypothetical protein
MTEQEYGIDIDILNHIEKSNTGDFYGNRDQRIARKVMVELVKAGRAEFLLLRDDEVSKWWGNIVTSASTAVETYREKMRVYKIKQAAWEKLTEEDRKILKIRKPIAPKR